MPQLQFLLTPLSLDAPTFPLSQIFSPERNRFPRDRQQPNRTQQSTIRQSKTHHTKPASGNPIETRVLIASKIARDALIPTEKESSLQTVLLQQCGGMELVGVVKQCLV